MSALFDTSRVLSLGVKDESETKTGDDIPGTPLACNSFRLLHARATMFIADDEAC